MYGNAYSVCPAGIYVAEDSALRRPEDLAGVEVGVGIHSGSHYSALQALEAFLDRTDIALGFVGRPFDRVRLALAGRVAAVNVWGAQAYMLEQQGFRKLVDTSFVMGFLLSPQADAEDVERYFRALLHAQQEIDLERRATATTGPGRCPRTCWTWSTSAASDRGSASCPSRTPGRCSIGRSAG